LVSFGLKAKVAVVPTIRKARKSAAARRGLELRG